MNPLFMIGLMASMKPTEEVLLELKESIDSFLNTPEELTIDKDEFKKKLLLDLMLATMNLKHQGQGFKEVFRQISEVDEIYKEGSSIQKIKKDLSSGED